MKSLTQYISEALVSKHTSKVYNYHPQTRDELKELIDKLIEDIKEAKEEDEDLLKPIADKCKEKGVGFKRVILLDNLDNEKSNVIIKFEFTKGTNRANRIYRLSRLKDTEIELVLDNLERAVREVL